MKLMLDLVVLAFQMDRTRLATLMLNNDLSQMNFKFPEGVTGALHLDLTHNGRAPLAEAMYLKTNQFHIAQFAYLVNRLKSIDEGGQSLLDSSLLMLCSNLFDGDTHGADQLPILLAGRAAGTLKLGRNLDYLDKGNDNRRACSLYLSLMDRMGVPLDRFGDATQRLPSCGGAHAHPSPQAPPTSGPRSDWHSPSGQNNLDASFTIAATISFIACATEHYPW